MTGGALVAGALVGGLLVAGLPVAGSPAEGPLVPGADVTGFDVLDGAGGSEETGDAEGLGGFAGPDDLGEPGDLGGPGAEVAGALPEPGSPVLGEPLAPGAVPDGSALCDVDGRAVLDGEEPPEVPAPLAGAEAEPPDAGREEAFPLPAGAEAEELPPFPGVVPPPGGGEVDVPFVPRPAKVERRQV